MKTVFYMLSLICVANATSARQNGLLTPSYHIVTDDDLAYDRLNHDISPYNPVTALSGLYWQCLPIDQMTAQVESWKAPDGGGPSNKVDDMCAFQIVIRRNAETQVYVGRRGQPKFACQKHLREWKRLTQNQNIICLNGEGGNYETDKKWGKYKLWTWVKFKTKLGCYSYFANECATNGCARGQGQCRR